MKIEEMPAGRDMDALIAKEVFKYSLTGDGYIKIHDVNSGLFTGYVKGIPNYSGDIAAAWEVVEKMRELDKYWSPWVYWDDDVWVCNFNYYGETEFDYKVFQGWADTVPLAICRAALKAMEVENGERT